MKRIVLTFMGLISCFWMIAQTTDTLKIYVSPEGNDSGTGTEMAPFKSFQQAVKTVVSSRAESPSKPVVVLFRGGSYPVTQTITVPSSASGTKAAPVIFRAAENEKPVFSGSVALTNWKPLKDASVAKRLSKDVAKHIVVVDLKSCGVTDFGKAVSDVNRPDLYCNGSLQTLARWPNCGFTYTGKARGATPTEKVWSGHKGTKEGIVEYCDSRINRWANEKDFKLHGYWFWDWRDNYFSTEVDTKNHLFNLEKPYTETYKDSLRYYGVGLLCELDSASEWYLDRTKGKLYWFPPKGINPSKAVVTLTNTNIPFMLEAKDCSYMTFEGLTFKGSRGSGLLLANTNHCALTECCMEELGVDAVHLDSCKEDILSYCLLQNLGAGGIIANGGDRATLTPANLLIEQNIVRSFSHYIHTYHPAVYFDGCGLVVTNNHFSDAPSSALRVDGNNIIIQFNEVDHVVYESDDQGGIDTFFDLAMRDLIIRYNYWHDITGGTLCGAAGVRLDDLISGVQIYGNVFFKCGSHEFGGVQMNGGKDNVVEDNLFIDCPYAITHNVWAQDNWNNNFKSDLQQKRIHEVTDMYSPLYLNRWPEIKHISENTNLNTVRNNLLINTPVVNKEKRDNQILVLSNNRQITVNTPITDVKKFCSLEYLRPLGMKAIPFEEIGVSSEH